MSNLVTIMTYDNYMTAHIVKARLANRGVEAFIKDEQTLTMNWLWNNALGGMKLQVKEEDATLALKILEEDEKEFEEQIQSDAYTGEDKSVFDPGNRICIHCGSKNTKRISYNKSWAYTAMLFLGFPIAVRSDKWHCFHCTKDF